MKQRKKRLISYVLVLVFLLISSPFLISYYYVPNEIKVAAGKESKINFNIPFSKIAYTKDNGQNQMTVSWMGVLPIKTVAVESVASKMVIPSGHIIGVSISSEGIYILGISEVETKEGTEKPCKDKLKKGDIIYKLNDIAIESKEHLQKLVEENGTKPISLEIDRRGERQWVEVMPVYSTAADTYKLGIWIKDGTQGIGTVTYIDPENNTFGALGHGITDEEMKKLIPIKEGKITKTTITSITKGEIGEAGQLSGIIDYEEKNMIGDVKNNTNLGIYGSLNEKGKAYLSGKKIPIAFQDEIHTGKATILLHLTGNGVEEYVIDIQKVSKYTSEPSKGMVIKIVDPRLLKLTNGIVQGMSGSPILQDGKLIGAVTHVFVQDPTKGYGIFIENMLNNE